MAKISGNPQRYKDIRIVTMVNVGFSIVKIVVGFQVDPRLSVAEGHQIGEYVRTRLMEAIEEIAAVTVHIDSEEDGASLLCNGLPSRGDIVSHLRERLSSVLDPARIENITLHYLRGKIYVELLVSLALVKDIEHAQRLAQQLRRAGESIEALDSIQIHFC